MLYSAIFVNLSLLFTAAFSHPTAEAVDQTIAPLSYPAKPIAHANLSDYLVAESKRDLKGRADGGVYITTDINWGGTTGYATQPWETCIHLDSPWYHTISSLGPDSGNAVAVSEDYYCDSPGYAIFYPGIADLTTVGWNDRIGSFIVHQVAVVNGAQCIYSVFAGTNCAKCCNGCDRSGQDCCPQGQIC